jgi:hypothetical protein
MPVASARKAPSRSFPARRQSIKSPAKTVSEMPALGEEIDSPADYGLRTAGAMSDESRQRLYRRAI